MSEHAPPGQSFADGVGGAAKVRIVHRMRARAGRVMHQLSDLVVPPLCLACREPITEHDALCASCWSGIAFIRPPLCERLGLPLPYAMGEGAVSAAAIANPPLFHRARAVAHYNGTMRRLVHDLKFHDRGELVRLLGGLMTEAASELLSEADVLVPIPLARMRLFLRRFNQAACLAQEAGRRCGLPCDMLSLVRTRATARQIGLSRTERIENVRGAFAVPPARRDRIEGRNVLLVDDVITTGATISAATRALLNAGALRVDVVALALATGQSEAAEAI